MFFSISYIYSGIKKLLLPVMEVQLFSTFPMVMEIWTVFSKLISQIINWPIIVPSTNNAPAHFMGQKLKSEASSKILSRWFLLILMLLFTVGQCLQGTTASENPLSQSQSE